MSRREWWNFACLSQGIYWTAYAAARPEWNPIAAGFGGLALLLYLWSRRPEPPTSEEGQ